MIDVAHPLGAFIRYSAKTTSSLLTTIKGVPTAAMSMQMRDTNSTSRECLNPKQAQLIIFLETKNPTLIA